jgi:hypothetical protein
MEKQGIKTTVTLSLNYAKLLSLLKREFKLFWQNKVLRILLLSPYFMVSYWDMYIGKVTDLPIIIVDQDRTEMSKQCKCLTTMKLLPLIQYYTTKIIF